jgi:hypothetical protein
LHGSVGIEAQPEPQREATGAVLKACGGRADESCHLGTGGGLIASPDLVLHMAMSQLDPKRRRALCARPLPPRAEGAREESILDIGIRAADGQLHDILAEAAQLAP